MRNQFVGDINDYHKYKLLNELSSNYDVSVCWMLNPDVEGQDSKFVKIPIRDELSIYLSRLVEYKHRNIKYIQVCPLIKVKRYYRQIRDINIHDINGILFFDPDNGIEVKSAKTTDNRYLFYSDIRKFITKVDILVYQHFPRVQRKAYMDKLTNDIHREVTNSKVIHYPTNMVDFILIKRNTPQPSTKRL